MDLSQVNYLAVFLAALSSFLLGGVWYSPLLFANAWMREAKLSEAELRVGVAGVFARAFLLALVIAFNLAMFLGPKPGVAWGAGAGALAGIGWAGASLATTFLFERRSARLIAIDVGYLAVSYPVMGAILGAMQ